MLKYKPRLKYLQKWQNGNEYLSIKFSTQQTAHFLQKFELDLKKTKILFQSRNSGRMGLIKEGDFLQLDFPADKPRKMESIPDIEIAFGRKPIASFEGRDDYLLIYETEQQIKSFSPDFATLIKLKKRGVIVRDLANADRSVVAHRGPCVVMRKSHIV